MARTIEVSDETYEKIQNQLGEEVEEIESLGDLIGKTYLFQCARYIYHGKVKSVNSTYIELKNAGIVYNTGGLKDNKAEDRQELPNNAFIMRNAIECFYKPKW